MKSLKFDHGQAGEILAGTKTSTWRVFDEKGLAVNDEVRVIDKVNPDRPETWRVVGIAHIDQVVEKRFSDITSADMEGHEKYSSNDELITSYRSRFGEKVAPSIAVKMIHFTFMPLDKPEIVDGTTKDVTTVKIYADGGSRGNPGPSASGFVVLDATDDSTLVDKGIYLGITTNNQAEYLALKYALEESLKMGARKVDAYMDSLLVVNQLKGIFKVRNRDLWPIHDSVKELTTKFEKFSITHVPRELNKAADAAVNRAMDEALGIEHFPNKPKVV